MQIFVPEKKPSPDSGTFNPERVKDSVEDFPINLGMGNEAAHGTSGLPPASQPQTVEAISNTSAHTQNAVGFGSRAANPFGSTMMTDQNGAFDDMEDEEFQPASEGQYKLNI